MFFRAFSGHNSDNFQIKTQNTLCPKIIQVVSKMFRKKLYFSLIPSWNQPFLKKGNKRSIFFFCKVKFRISKRRTIDMILERGTENCHDSYFYNNTLAFFSKKKKKS